MLKSLIFAFLALPVALSYSQPVLDGPTHMCLVERSKVGKSKRMNLAPYSESIVLRALADGGMQIQGGELPPLVSREMLEYSVVSTTGALSMLTGYVHLETSADGSLNFTSDKGSSVVLKTEVNSITWIVDRSKAMENALKAGAHNLLIVEVESEDITNSLSNADQYGSQRSINVLLAASLLRVPKGTVLAGFSKSITKMDAVESSAIREGVEYLAAELAKKLSPK
jgi:hypothetical protein